MSQQSLADLSESGTPDGPQRGPVAEPTRSVTQGLCGKSFFAFFAVFAVFAVKASCV